MRINQLFLHQFARLSVDGTEGLVHQKYIRPSGKRSRKAHTLLHAAGELMRISFNECLKAYALDVRHRDLARLGRIKLPDRQRKNHVVDDGLPGKQSEGLEHHRPFNAGFKNRLPFHDHLTLIRQDQRCHDP